MNVTRKTIFSKKFKISLPKISGKYGLPKRHGKLKVIDKFDASAFGIHPKQASNMDPQARVLLEVVYESIVDAGRSII